MILRWIGKLCRQLHLCFLAVTPRDSVGNRSPTVRTLAELSSTLMEGRKQVHRGSIREVNLEPIKDYEVNEAEEFWEILSPQRYLFSPQNRPIFRGQADSDWKLIPSILRGQDHPAYSAVIFRGSPEQSDQRIFVEIATLLTFAEYCDSAGLRIPSDSSNFRSNFLDPTKVMDTFIFIANYGRRRNTTRSWQLPSTTDSRPASLTGATDRMSRRISLRPRLYSTRKLSGSPCGLSTLR